MDISTLIKKLDLSAMKVAWFSIFDRDALYEYVVDKANSGVNLILAANSEQVARIRVKLANLSNYLHDYAAYVPEPWKPYASAINSTLLAVYNATEDYCLDKCETKAIVNEFRLAYSAFKAE